MKQSKVVQIFAYHHLHITIYISPFTYHHLHHHLPSKSVRFPLRDGCNNKSLYCSFIKIKNILFLIFYNLDILVENPIPTNTSKSQAQRNVSSVYYIDSVVTSRVKYSTTRQCVIRHKKIQLFLCSSVFLTNFKRTRVQPISTNEPFHKFIM